MVCLLLDDLLEVWVSECKLNSIQTPICILSPTNLPPRLSMVVPLYIAEISPPQIRGTLLVFEQFSIVAGIIISFVSSSSTIFLH